MYWPTRSSRVTATRCPLRMYPKRCRIVAIRIATVVLPVPGLPVKDMCRLGPPAENPRSRRSRSTSSSAAISRMRVFTGASPIRSRSSSRNSSLTPVSASADAKLLASSGRLALGFAGVAVDSQVALATIALATHPLGWQEHVCRLIPSAFGLRHNGVTLDRVAHRATGLFLAHQPKPRLIRGPVHDESKRDRFDAVRGVERRDTNVVLRKCFPAARELLHDA